MRLVMGLCLVLGLSFALAGSARAGAFGLPMDDDACGSTDVVGVAMSDPNFAFTDADSVKQCESLCKKSGKICSSTVKESAKCYSRYWKNLRSFGYKNCKVITDNKSDLKSCKQSYKEGVESELEDNKAAQDEGVADCDFWTETCQEACSAPM